MVLCGPGGLCPTQSTLDPSPLGVTSLQRTQMVWQRHTGQGR